MANQSNYSKGLIVGAIIGAAVGSITALLFAPKSGKELREDIAQKSGELYDKAGDMFNSVETNVSSAINTTVNEGKIRAQRIINSARHQAEELLASAENVLHDARSRASYAKDNIQHKIENLREAAKASADAFKNEMGSTNQES